MDRHGDDKQTERRTQRSRISRRDFLGATAGAAGALGLAAGGVHGMLARNRYAILANRARRMVREDPGTARGRTRLAFPI